MREQKYCSKCGARLRYEIVGAEKVPIYMPYDIWYHSKYDTQTGKRQFGTRYFCPNAWLPEPFSKHDSFYEEQLLEQIIK